MGSAGNVLLANAPGSGFLESPGVLGFLPKLAESLLGETLEPRATSTST
ncbi:circularly permuted type 2 ATP-grasp protein [Burkholderia gladioli]|nr:circularly permuted type 2 ATP-grasp protein [Burkholderia gladioli]